MAWVRLPGAAEKGKVCLQLTVTATALIRCVVSTVIADSVTEQETRPLPWNVSLHPSNEGDQIFFVDNLKEIKIKCNGVYITSNLHC